MKLLGSSQTVVFVLRTKVFAKTILEHYSQTAFTKTVHILRSGLTNSRKSLAYDIHVCHSCQSYLLCHILPDTKWHFSHVFGTFKCRFFTGSNTTIKKKKKCLESDFYFTPINRAHDPSSLAVPCNFFPSSHSGMLSVSI